MSKYRYVILKDVGGYIIRKDGKRIYDSNCGTFVIWDNEENNLLKEEGKLKFFQNKRELKRYIEITLPKKMIARAL